MLNDFLLGTYIFKLISTPNGEQRGVDIIIT